MPALQRDMHEIIWAKRGMQPTATACVMNFYLGELQLWVMLPPRQRNMYICSIISCNPCLFSLTDSVVRIGLNSLDLTRKKKYVYKSSEVNHVAFQ